MIDSCGTVHYITGANAMITNKNCRRTFSVICRSPANLRIARAPVDF